MLPVPVTRFKAIAINLALYSAIILGTLVVVDLALNALGLFPPTYDYGDPDAGWVAAVPSGGLLEADCIEFSTGERATYTRNEDAARTSISARRLREDSALFAIAVSGDSQTELCASNAQTHFGVLERELTAQGHQAVAFAYGAGKYSPLQAYLAVRKLIGAYAADAFVLNFYTGNDFYDMLRVDDRPHFVRGAAGYEIAPPVWYQQDPPGIKRHSRVLYALRTIGKRTGARNVLLRLRYLRAIAVEQGKGVPAVLAYMNDLRRSATPEVGYSAAFAAQMLNQQLFFYRFPGAREETIQRVGALMQLIRRDHPDMILVVSALPSYQLVQQQPVDSAFVRVFERLPLSYAGGVREEGELYETLRRLASETGWLFVDNLAPLRQYAGPERLFNDFDYHYLPVASEFIGRAQAETIAAHLRGAGFGSP
jgi:hypothetical protein